MKGRRSVILIGLVLIVLIITYLQWGREVKVCDSSIEKSENYYSENLTIITNKIWVIDKEEFANDMVQKSIDNSFKNVRFSYDLGQPNELCIVVFVNNMRYRRGEPNFTILFRQKEKA